MDDLFGAEPSGPSAAELRKREIERSKARERAVRNAAISRRRRGVTQLFAPSNPALNLPNSSNDNGNTNA